MVSDTIGVSTGFYATYEVKSLSVRKRTIQTGKSGFIIITIINY